MKERFFQYEDIEDNDIRLEINMDILRVRAFATTHNFNGEVVSRNKIVGWWSAKNKTRLFKILRNNIGNMSYKTREKYLKFVDELEGDYK